MRETTGTGCGELGRSKLRALYNEGSGRFSRSTRILDTEDRAKILDDLNGDGRLDLKVGPTTYLSSPTSTPGATCR